MHALVISMLPYALGVLSALLYVAGYPAGLGWWPLSCVALAPLLWALDRHALTPRRALAVGALFAVLAQLIGYAFIPGTLVQFGKLPWLACLFVHLLLCSAQAGGMALWLSALAWGRARGASVLVLAPPLWVVQELAWPNVFEAPLGAALHDVPVLAQGAELGGVALVSLLVASINAVTVALALGVARADHPRLKRALCGVIAIAGIAYAGSVRLADVEEQSARAPALRVGLVQASLSAEAKRKDPLAYAERYVALSRAIREPFELLIWPETALARPVSTSVQHMRDAHPSLGQVHAPMLVGAVTQDDVHIFNSALLFGADGQRIGRIDKHKLLPFAEMLPLGERFPALYSLIRGAGHFTAGAATPVLALENARLAIFICYEDMLAESVRQVVANGDANLLVSISNDAWFGESRAAYTHFAAARLRAIELRRTLVRSTNTGVSAVIDPTGRLVGRLPEHTAATLVARAPLLDMPTLYARAGNALTLALTAAWLALGWLVPTGSVATGTRPRYRRRSQSGAAT